MSPGDEAEVPQSPCRWLLHNAVFSRPRLHGDFHTGGPYDTCCRISNAESEMSMYSFQLVAKYLYWKFQSGVLGLLTLVSIDVQRNWYSMYPVQVQGFLVSSNEVNGDLDKDVFFIIGIQVHIGFIVVVQICVQ